MKNKDSNLIGAVVDQMAMKIINDVGASVTADMADFIKGRIAAGFPKHLESVVDIFFNQEVAPELMAMLLSHKDEIVKKIQGQIIDYATKKILSEIGTAIEKAREAFDFDAQD
jgi:hypothetical protein